MLIALLKRLWLRLSALPLGKWLFSRIIGFNIPYTGTITPLVVQLRPGYAEVRLKERRMLRNHLGSVHALALANLGELTSGLSVHFAMGEDMQAILTRLSVEFLKKARGTITAVASFAPADLPKDGSIVVEARLFDDEKNLVAVVSATWLLRKINHAKQLKN